MNEDVLIRAIYMYACYVGEFVDLYLNNKHLKITISKQVCVTFALLILDNCTYH